VSQDDTDEVKLAALKQWLIDNPPTVAYKTAEPLSTEPITFTPEYIGYDKGSEEVLTPTDESGNTCFDYGANTTEDNSYYVIVGGGE
jgi:hypothetical protein